MAVFTPTHLGKWEPLYRDLLEGETLPLTADGTWMLADRPGLIAVFDDSEVVYIGDTDKLGKELQMAVNGSAESELRTLIAVVELGASPKNASSRAKNNGPLAVRVTRRVEKMRYRIVPAPAAHLPLLAEAFAVVADPRYNGPTAKANAALDALPK